mmetsp:Transcript_24039/g.41188  ORF Transcript_24039/g.41188 Transcript_24039/m.41188 type:complete len:400 (+) Transcript_24039:153-1352(+)|eukprot:CAMPEP_0183709618 /NCGR_PEP_ID=MMETSP0737-20130205/5631_1 /TAXON_ID=385413 /ORGANISM="Thalassiosira miniscula, Strain CCMP1093" /LENGTH=399 /DNA_ID=CAMNT_0025937767 /DNA_START=360 /DNA_END=1559 /DNA_ORIENTATION=-
MAKQSNGHAPSKPSSKQSGVSLSYQAIIAMSLLALQFGIQPIVTQQFTSKKIIKSTVIFMQEVVKLIIGVIGISLGKTGWKEVTSGWTFLSWIRLALLPATIYLIQNMCSLLAYQNLDAITYNVLNQTKTLSAALCCYLLLKKKQSTVQMLALLLLLMAALVMEGVLPMDVLLPSYWLNGKQGTTNGGDLSETLSSLSPRHFSHGVLPIMVASFLSGLAGAITQKSLQAGNRNALLFTIELCVASLLLLAASFATSDDGKQIAQRGFFSEWNAFTLIPILTNSAGGILVGLVIKYAGTVRKGFALIFGILISGIFQSLLDEDKALSKEDVVGGMLAALSLWMHATHPYVVAATTTTKQQQQQRKQQQTIHASNGATNGTTNGTTSKAVRKGGRKSRKED